MLHRGAGGHLSGGLCGEGRALLAATETLSAGGSPGDGVALGIGDSHHGIVEGRTDMDLASLNVLLLAAAADDPLASLRCSHNRSPSLLLLVGNGLLGTLAGACVGFAALAAHGQAAAVADAPVAADLGQALDVQGHGAAQVALHGVAVVNGLTELVLVRLGQILHAGVGVDPRLCQDILGALSSNPIDIGEADLNPLILGQVNTGNSCH